MLQITSLKVRKLVQSMVGQIRAGNEWSRWAAHAQLCDIRVWVHAPSVGEGLVAEPVLVRLARSVGRPLTVIRTYTSPSAANWAGGFPYDRSDFLPSPGSLSEMIRSINPSLIVYPRADLWPVLVARAADATVPQVVVGGSVRSDSRRLKWPGRRMNARMVRRITAIGAVSDADIRSWQQIGAPLARIVLTGDPRDDHVLDRISDVRWLKTLTRWSGGDFVLLAGSTHQSDEEHILKAAGRSPGRTIIVPHDPTPSTIRRLVSSCGKRGIKHTVFSPPQTPPDRNTKLLIVGPTGGLQDLYALASVAFVGGGFDGTRVHSLLEPAAMGVPILVGPGAIFDPSANRFVESGGARLVRDSDEITAACHGWQHEGTRRTAGLKARAVLSVGAAQKTVDLILRVLDR